MTFEVAFHQAASQHYQEAYSWYESQKIGLGEHFFVAFTRKLDSITKFPKAFPEKTKKGYREAVLDIFPYSKVYKIYARQHVILVLALYHHKRRPSGKFLK
jgi:hypothetical protein